MPLSLLILRDSGLGSAIKQRLVGRHRETVFDMPLPALSDASMAEINDAFTHIAEWIWQVLESSGREKLRGALTFLEIPDDPDGSHRLDAMRPLNERTTPYASLAGLLVLAFPELHWIFHTYVKLPNLPGFSEAHTFQAGRPLEDYLSWRRMGYAPLFDPTGFRHLMQANCTPDGDEQDGADKTHHRSKRTAVIDEEPEYSYFNSLALYKCGYLVWTTTTYFAMQKFFSDPAKEGNIDVAPCASIEDLYLHFADRPEKDKLSVLEQRDEFFPQLQATSKRAFMTIGHSDSDEERKTSDINDEYLKKRTDEHFSNKLIYKPAAGIYGVLRDGGFWDENRQCLLPAEGFLSWLGAGAFRKDENGQIVRVRREGKGKPVLPHSAPGRLLMVAGVLMERSAALVDGKPSVLDTIHAAVLAMTAKELLRGQTPTTSMEAIELQHEAELMAECQFNGVQLSLDMKWRLREGREEIEQVATFYGEKRRARVILNARASLAERLGSRCREFHQVQEERECMAESRHVEFKMLTDRWWSKPLRPVFFIINLALRSLPAFIGLLATSTVLFGCAYFVLQQFVDSPGLPNGHRAYELLHCIVDSAYYTFTLAPPFHWDLTSDKEGLGMWLWDGLLTAQAAISFCSLGLLLSHLYIIVSRK